MERHLQRPLAPSRPDIVLLGVASGFWPLSVLARNVVGIPHPERVATLILMLWLASIAISWLLIRVGVRRSVAVRTVFVAVVLFMSAGRLTDELGKAGVWVGFLAVVSLAGWLFSRLDDETIVGPVMVALSVALASGVVLSLVTSLTSLGTDATEEAPALDFGLIQKPDIFIVVLDGYPGLQTMGSLFSDDKESLRTGLTEAGFQVPESAWSSYWSTSASIPSLLQMSYPVTVWQDGLATEQALYDIVGGDNVLVDWLDGSGYRTHMVESGWSGSSCGPAFDLCVASPILDEATYLMLRDSMLGDPVLSRLGHPFTLGTEHTMEWLSSNVKALSDNSHPDFVFAHLVAPHDPFYLDPSCSRVVSDTRLAAVRQAPGFPDDTRTGFFIGQTECVDRFMLGMADLVDEEVVVVFVSDHGTATSFQLETPAGEWTSEQIEERMSVFVAVRAKCPLGQTVVIPNLMRRVLACYSSDDVSLFEPRMFLPPLVEIEETAVAAIIALEVITP